MNRFDPDLILTTSEVAELLGVHPSSVKRWCNEGEIRSEKTAGGHRRVHLEDAVAFARARSIPNFLGPFHPYEAHVWTAFQEVERSGSSRAVHSLAMGWLHRGHLPRIGALYDALARRPAVSLCDFCDHGIRGLMVEVGRAWHEGRIRAGEEHMVSQVMVEVLLKLRAELRDEDAWTAHEPDNVAVVGTLEGNQHHLGSLCIRLLLETRGWHVCYLGPDVPVEDFAVIQRGRRAGLVCISLPSPAAPGDVARAVSTLGEFYDPSRPYALALGGTVPEDMDASLLEGPFRSVGIFSRCSEFTAELDAGWVEGATVEAAR